MRVMLRAKKKNGFIDGTQQHAVNDGEAGRGRSFKANATQALGTPSGDQHLTETDKTELGNLSSEEWGQLVSLWKTNKGVNCDRSTGKNCDMQWILDTGVSHHMTGSIECLRNVCNIETCPVGMPNGEEANAVQKGTVVLGANLQLANVLFVPNLTCNLISVSQLLCDKRIYMQITHKLCVLQDRATRTMIGVGEQRGGLYYLRGVACVRANKATRLDSADLWHKRMGHPSMRAIELLPQVSSFVKLNKVEHMNCDVCFKAKQTRTPFVVSNNRASAKFGLIHCDLWGPYREPASCGARYFFTIVDDYTRAVWIYLLKDKGEVSRQLIFFFALVERQYGTSVKVVRSDNGSEFIGMDDYFKTHGIVHQTSMVGTPQQNARVERKHRHILNVGRALRFQASLPIQFWGECVLTAGKTPFELLFDHPPSLAHIRVFGCLCYAKTLNKEWDKFASRSRKCVFVGYPSGKK